MNLLYYVMLHKLYSYEKCITMLLYDDDPKIMLNLSTTYSKFVFGTKESDFPTASNTLNIVCYWISYVTYCYRRTGKMQL